MAAIYNYWIRTAGFDGFRIDTAKHVEMGFWQDWCPAVPRLRGHERQAQLSCSANVWTARMPNAVPSYTQGAAAFKMDSVVDYPLYFKVSSVFASASGNTKQIEDHYNAIAANYDPAAQMRLVTFLDNHDRARFLSIGGATTARLDVALAFLYTSRGVPCLYYWNRAGLQRHHRPNDREDTVFRRPFEQGPSLGDNFNMMTHPQFLVDRQN